MLVITTNLSRQLEHQITCSGSGGRRLKNGRKAIMIDKFIIFWCAMCGLVLTGVILSVVYIVVSAIFFGDVVPVCAYVDWLECNNV